MQGKVKGTWKATAHGINNKDLFQELNKKRKEKKILLDGDFIQTEGTVYGIRCQQVT